MDWVLLLVDLPRTRNKIKVINPITARPMIIGVIILKGELETDGGLTEAGG